MPLSPFDAHLTALENYLSSLNQEVVSLFTWKGTDYSCVYNWTAMKYLDQGGFVPQDALVIEPLESLPIPGPQLEDMITLKAKDENGEDLEPKDFRIMQITRQSGKPPRLTCYDPARGT